MSEDTTTIKLVTKRRASFCSIVAQMILVLSRRTQSLNEGGYEHSLTHMLCTGHRSATFMLKEFLSHVVLLIRQNKSI